MNNEDRSNQVGTTKETEQYVLNYSFDDVFKILTVAMVAYNPATNSMDRVQIGSDGGLRSGDSAMATRIDDTAPPITYVGKAVPGTSPALASWQIQRIDETSGTVVTYADGDADYDNIWNNRTSLTYS